MPPFGFFPGEPLTKTPPPAGYFAAGVKVGSLHESVFSSSKLWSAGDYVFHWRRTAERYLEEPCVSWFCSSLDMPSCSCFVAYPSADYCTFEEHLIPRRMLIVEGPFIRAQERTHPSAGT